MALPCMGPRLSGSNVHVDPLCTAAWNTVLQGQKYWVLFPPDTPEALLRPKPVGEEEARCDESTALINGAAAWYEHILPKTKSQDWPSCYRPIEILQVAGETMFVPQGWWHAVLNLDLTVAVTQNLAGAWDFEDVWNITNSKRKWMVQPWLEGLKVEHPELAEVVESTKQRTMDSGTLRCIFDEVDVDKTGSLCTESAVAALIKVHRELQSGKSAEHLRSEVYFKMEELDGDEEELGFTQFCCLVKKTQM